MKHKISKKRFALFAILLIISIPFYSSMVFAATAPEEYAAQYMGMDAPLAYDVSDIQSSEVVESAEACIEKNEKNNAIVDALDNDVINRLEQVVIFLQTLCGIIDLVQTIISAVNTVIGSVDGCCYLPPIINAICVAVSAVYKVWTSMYSVVFKNFCCVFSCGTCMGRGDCGLGFAGLNLQFSLDPKSSIFIAVGCGCVPGIMYHMRKLKLIYQVYDCCIEEACNTGFSPALCEEQFDIQTCMFYYGGLASAVISVVLNAVSGLIVTGIAEILKKYGLSLCYVAWFDTLNLPTKWVSLLKTIDELSKTFDEPDCSELGFGTEIDFDPVDYSIRIRDTDGDGKYDSYTIIYPEDDDTENGATGNVVSSMVTGFAIGDTTESAPEDSGSSDTTSGDSSSGEIPLEATTSPSSSNEIPVQNTPGSPSVPPPPHQGSGNIVIDFLNGHLYDPVDVTAHQEGERNFDVDLFFDTVPDAIQNSRIDTETQFAGQDVSDSEFSDALIDNTIHNLNENGLDYTPEQVEGLLNNDNLIVPTGTDDAGNPVYGQGYMEDGVVYDGATDKPIENQGDFFCNPEQTDGQILPPHERDYQDQIEIRGMAGHIGQLFSFLISQYLQEDINDEIKQYCIDMVGSSGSEGEPQDQTISHDDVEINPCSGRDSVTTATALAERKDYEFTYSYFVFSCKQDLNAQVRLEGAGRQNILASGFLRKGDSTLQDSSTKTAGYFYDKICILTNDEDVGENGKICSDIVVK